MFIIGSQALKLNGIRVEPNDIDLLASVYEYELIKKFLGDKLVYEKANKFGKTLFAEGYPPIELFIMSHDNNYLSNLDLSNIVYDNSLWSYQDGEKLFDIKFYPVSNDVLLTLKLSHRYLKNSPHFNKTRRDIIKLRKAGAKVPACLEGWLKKREEETYNYSHPNLKQEKNNFFSNDGVKYVYDHDSLHEVVAVGSEPAYKYIKVDGADVQVSKEKFFSLPYRTQLLTVLEESYVLALERSIIPFGFKDAEKPFLMALEKVCTSISSGWWREFAWENYDEVKALYNPNYYEKFLAAKEKGLLKPYKTQTVENVA